MRRTRMFAIATCIATTDVNATVVAAQVPQKALPSATASALSAPQLSLDEWIILRFRNAQLIPDSGSAPSNVVARAGAPRIEGARAPDRRDTLVAVHFDTTFWRASISAGAGVHFADPSGELTAILGRVTARRAFRAPRKAGARATNTADWRIGWAYLIAIPARTASAAPSGFNGWSVVDSPANTKRASH